MPVSGQAVTVHGCLKNSIVAWRPASKLPPGMKPAARSLPMDASECFTSPGRSGAWLISEREPVKRHIIVHDAVGPRPDHPPPTLVHQFTGMKGCHWAERRRGIVAFFGRRPACRFRASVSADSCHSSFSRKVHNNPSSSVCNSAPSEVPQRQSGVVQSLCSAFLVIGRGRVFSAP